MKVYDVCLDGIFRIEVKIEAKTKKEALKKVKEVLKNSEIVSFEIQSELVSQG